MIRPCRADEFEAMLGIINDAAQAYRGVIPADRWHEPYMTAEYLRGEIDAGVRFSGLDEEGALLGVMGIQDVDAQDAEPVTLIRHAYVRPDAQRRGVGGHLLAHLREMTDRRILIGTWADASWAVAFYERNGFHALGREETSRLLRTYWDIPERQVETSVVLAARSAAGTPRRR